MITTSTSLRVPAYQSDSCTIHWHCIHIHIHIHTLAQQENFRMTHSSISWKRRRAAIVCHSLAVFAYKDSTLYMARHYCVEWFCEWIYVTR